MSNTDLDRLGSARHVALTTFRADGSAVTNCMWIAREGDRLYLLTHAGSGKVARIRADPRVSLAPSDGRGRPQGGSSIASAVVDDRPESVKRASSLLRRRYGPQYGLLRLLMRVRGGAGAPVAIRISEPTPVSAPPGT